MVSVFSCRILRPTDVEQVVNDSAKAEYRRAQLRVQNLGR